MQALPVASVAELRRQMVALYSRMLDLVLLKEEKRLQHSQASAPTQGAGAHDEEPDSAAEELAVAAAAAAVGVEVTLPSTATGTAPPGPSTPAPTPDLSRLLQSDLFHRGLACVCAELLVRAVDLHAAPGGLFAFPASCVALGASPVEVCPLMVTVVDVDPSVPRELRRHLNTLAETILECSGWERGSRLYDYLQTMHRRAVLAGTSPPPTVSGMLPAAILAPGVVDEALERSAHHRVPVFQETPDQAQVLAAAKGADKLVRAFVSQVMTLASLRLQKLADRLNFPDTLRAVAVAAVEYALQECTHLFYGRQVDQVLLCSLYGAAKAAEWPRREEPLLFRDIIAAYRAVHRRDRGVPAPEAVYRRVALAYPTPLTVALEPSRYDDIIKFYNATFVPCMKPFLLRCVQRNNAAGGAAAGQQDVDQPDQPDEPQADGAGAGAARGDVTGTPGGAVLGGPFPGLPPRPPTQNARGMRSPRPPFSILPVSSPRRAGGVLSHSVMVSPLRPDAVSPMVAPRSGSLYAFLGESSQALQSPGRDLEYINARVAASGFAHTPSLVDTAAAAAAADAFAHHIGARGAGIAMTPSGRRRFAAPAGGNVGGDAETEAAAALVSASSQGDLAAAASDLPTGTTPSSQRRRPAGSGARDSPPPQRRRLEV